MNLWRDRLAKISITLAVVGFLASFAISLRSYGINEGLAIGEQELEEFKKEVDYRSEISFSSAVIGTYESFATEYGWLASLFMISTVGFLMISICIDRGIRNIGFLTAALPSLLIIYKLQYLIRMKTGLEGFWERPRNAFAQQTIAFDWLLIALTVFMSAGLAILFVFRSRTR